MHRSVVATVRILGVCLLSAIGYGFGITSAIADTVELPNWVQRIEIKGDFRFRYQDEETEPGGDERKRYRIRFRPGLTSEITDKWSFAFGLATGGDDLRSTNQTFTEFSTYDIRLDLAYATYEYSDGIEVLIGKMKNPIWNPKDLIWDTDIRPDGAAGVLTFTSSDSFSWFLTPGFFALGEYRDEKEDKDFEALTILQGGVNADLSETAYLRLAATAHLFNDIPAGTFAESAGSNTEAIENALSVEAEFGYTALPVFIAVIGQYVTADADEGNAGYLLGFKAGDKSVKSRGDWQVEYNYRSLESNAFPDFLMDSDAAGGATGIEGSEFEVVVGIAGNITFGIDYYMMQSKIGDGEENLLQLDLVLKFP